MDHNNNWNLLSILEIDRTNENNELRQDFAQNGYNDTEYNPSTTTSTFLHFSGSSSSITDSFCSSYVSIIEPPKILPIHKIFDLPKIVPLLKQSPLDGFGAVSLGSVSPLPPKSPDVFKTVTNKKLNNTIKYCYICARNPKMFYESHTVRDSNGNINCPVLLNYICKTCGVSAHTEKYCPSLRETTNDQLHEQWRNISFCTFCKSCVKTHPNRIVYSHNTNDFDGNIQCLTLKNYLCSKCGAMGKDAHTDDDCVK